MFLLSGEGSAAERIRSFWWLGDGLGRLAPTYSSHPVELCAKYEVLRDCPEADGVLERIPPRKFLLNVFLCWLTADEGIIFVVLQTENISHYSATLAARSIRSQTFGMMRAGCLILLASDAPQPPPRLHRD